ncbi:HEAT repeat domain-containing protein [Candidatus Pacearchaeota archaeon]|nr:HEAT repeat domain-containing protein [Candidatus Pacearchaeota archaeon]
MRKIKVFISSVITDFKKYRDAAEVAISDLNRDTGFNFEAIRIEPNKSPAMNKSSQKACLDEVNACDIYLGIYGGSYGWGDSPVGISPTHEEFREAIGKKKCLIFVESVEKDPKQIEFLIEVGNYIKGRFWNKFETPENLRYSIYRSLLKLMESNFEDFLLSYLKSLLLKYKQIDRIWKENVDSLPTNEVVQLELREEKQKEENKSLIENDGIERHSEELSKSLMFADAIQQKPRLLIMGDPGAGKSTSLQWITYSYAEQILNHSQKELPVPIYLELKWYNGSLLELIATFFGKNTVVCDEETIIDWIKKEKFIFLFDGFDELDDPSKCLKDINNLIGTCSRESRFVVTSRKIEALKDFKSLKFKKVLVKQLSNPQMELFTEKYLGKERGSRLLKELERHSLITEARNPLILWFMILEFQSDESQISANKGVLFKNVIEHHFLNEWNEKVIPTEFDRQKYTDFKIEVLTKLAFFIVVGDDSLRIEEGKAKEIIDDFLKEGRTDYRNIRDEILRQLFKSHILIKLGTKVSFWHKSFRDYFAALKLVEIFERNPEGFMNQYATERWEGAILFLVGIMDNPSDFVDRLVQPFWRDIIKYRDDSMFRLSLAAKCIGANNRVNIETQEKVIEQLTRIIQMWESEKKHPSPKFLVYSQFYTHLEAFQALGEMKSEKAADYLGEYLESNEYSQRAVNAMRNVPLTKKAQNSLLYAALRHEDGVVRRYATEILVDNMSQETESKLLQVLNDRQETSRVRKYALNTLRGGYSFDSFHSLSKIKKYSDDVICSMVKLALEESVEDLRRRVASTLGTYGGEDRVERIINPLIQALLKNPDTNIRDNAAYALFFYSTPYVRKALIQALDDESSNVRARSAYAFAYIGIGTQEEEEEVSRKLLSLFNDHDNTVRINAIFVYGRKRRNPRDDELSQLINLLKDENNSIRYFAAEALGFLKAGIALETLKQMVRDEKFAYTWASAIWAILQIEPSFSAVIKENGWESPYIIMLFDDDIDKRKLAVEVLGRIGTEIALPFLKKINEDHEKRKDMDSELFYSIYDIEERIKNM